MERLNSIWEKFGKNNSGLILYQLNIDSKFSDVKPWNTKYGVKYPTVFWTHNDDAGMKLGEVLVTKTDNVWTGGTYFIIKPDKSFITTQYEIDEFEKKLDDLVNPTHIENPEYTKHNNNLKKTCRVWFYDNAFSVEITKSGKYSIDIYSPSGKHLERVFNGNLQNSRNLINVKQQLSKQTMVILKITNSSGTTILTEKICF